MEEIKNKLTPYEEFKRSGDLREVIVLSEEDARYLAEDGGVEGYEVVENEQIDSRRWVSCHELIIRRKSDGKFFRSYYEQGLTESQDQAPFEYDEPKFTQVFQATEVRVVYK